MVRLFVFKNQYSKDTECLYNKIEDIATDTAIFHRFDNLSHSNQSYRN